MSLKSLRTRYVETFNAIIPKWQEVRSAAGGLDAMNYDKNEGGKATNTTCSAVVKPSKSDFCCDVEIAARRVLVAKQLAYFNSYYRDSYGQIEDVTAENAEMDLALREVLGARLLNTGVAPLGKYFQPTDTRGRRG